MDASSRAGIWIIATGIIIALLYLGRAILAPFAMAVFLFFVMEGFARAIDNKTKLINRAWARTISVFTVAAGFGLFIAMMARGIGQFGGQAGAYERRINNLISDIYEALHLSDAPSLADMLFGEPGQRLLGAVGSATGELSNNLILIFIYVAFMFLAQSTWSTKLDRIFPDAEKREQARSVGDAARRGIETYLWTQTVISAMITFFTYITLILLGVEGALFLSAMIFILNYIPTIGSIVAAFIPLLFALVQPDLPAWTPGDAPQSSYIYAAIVFASVSFWQFSIGNFVQPRMMGESLNLSALVVLISLSVWGAIWGIPGMFLSAPLTVLMMILFAQSDGTRWLAIALSADGKPSFHEKAAPTDHAEPEKMTSA